MAKKKKEQEQKPQESQSQPKIPKELEEKFKAIKDKVEKFQKEIVKKFEKYIIGVALLPPPQAQFPQGLPPEMPEEEKKKFEEAKDKIHILVLIDDSEPSKMTKAELKEKLSAIMEQTAKETDPKLSQQTVLLSEVWQSCYDGKSDLLQMIAISAPIYDTGMLSAIKISEIHKTMVLKKFEKYIVVYALAGSLVQGKATKESDIDVCIVVDDTDVKKMTRAELKDKLRAIIIGMGIEAGEMTGIRNKLNVQVWILTDFWDGIREANPVFFTFLRDGIPFFDRGIFMPWKQLLKMGKIKPSPEAIDMYLSTGEQFLERVKFKLKDIGTEDFFWAILSPSQAALMMYGIPPPTPKETPEMMREIFVKKEKFLEDKDVATLEKVIKIRKEVEHGTKKEVSGKEIDDLVKSCEEYLKRIRDLFSKIENMKNAETVLQMYDTIVTVIRDVLTLEGVERVGEDELIHVFEEEMISTGKVPAKFLRSLHDVMKAKKDYEQKKLSKSEVDQIRKTANEFIRFVVEYMQRKRGKELARARLRVKYGGKYGEVTLLGNTAYIVKDMDEAEKKLSKAEIKADGSLGSVENTSFEELEKSLAKIAVPPKVFIREPLFESLKKIFGKDVEILVVNA